MSEHDFRYALLNPVHNLTECRAITPGRYQVTGTGGSIRKGDILLVTLKGSRELSLRLTVEKIRYQLNPPGQWLAVANGPAFRELRIVEERLDCAACGKRLDMEVALDAALGKAAKLSAIAARLTEIGWQQQDGYCHCPACRKERP
ncbi:hypothetical protein [Azomonas macrocytogenes]|uniref:Uncharacterized protein n=1 Tax=Azomonas macrocytogenes TaxID=69962 RepID=A0A839T9V2_AZOMA|nr:hypothetical protein [Azomonas macrocytogenes]MBB3104964.1 hypothetical protein [Azomonas macrocytogenes]